MQQIPQFPNSKCKIISRHEGPAQKAQPARLHSVIDGLSKLVTDARAQKNMPPSPWQCTTRGLLLHVHWFSNEAKQQRNDDCRKATLHVSVGQDEFATIPLVFQRRSAKKISNLNNSHHCDKTCNHVKDATRLASNAHCLRTKNVNL